MPVRLPKRVSSIVMLSFPSLWILGVVFVRTDRYCSGSYEPMYAFTSADPSQNSFRGQGFFLADSETGKCSSPLSREVVSAGPASGGFSFLGACPDRVAAYSYQHNYPLQSMGATRHAVCLRSTVGGQTARRYAPTTERRRYVGGTAL